METFEINFNEIISLNILYLYQVKCSVLDRKSETDRYLVPPACYSEYLRNVVKTGDGSVLSGNVADMAAAARAGISFLQNLEEILSSNK